jgi:hypothetical protein
MKSGHPLSSMSPHVNRYGVVVPISVSFGASDAYPDIFRGFLKSSKKCVTIFTKKGAAAFFFFFAIHNHPQ